MGIEYAPDDAMTAAVAEMVGNTEFSEFGLLREQELVFMVAGMRKEDKDGNPEPTTGEPIVVRKVSAADAVFMEGHFKVYIDGFRWDEANEVQRKAMLHRGLLRVSVEKTEKGTIVLGLTKPDALVFQQNIVRFGAWEEQLILLRNNLQTAQAKAKRAAQPTASAV